MAQKIERGDFPRKRTAKLSFLHTVKKNNILIFRLNDNKRYLDRLRAKDEKAYKEAFEKLKKNNEYIMQQMGLHWEFTSKIYFVNSTDYRKMQKKEYQDVKLVDSNGEPVQMDWSKPYSVAGIHANRYENGASLSSNTFYIGFSGSKNGLISNLPDRVVKKDMRTKEFVVGDNIKTWCDLIEEKYAIWMFKEKKKGMTFD